MVVLMPIGFTPVPAWFSFDNQGAAVASADVSGNGRPDLVVLMIDSAPDQNSGLYRVGADVDATGAVTGGWGPWQPVPDWFSFENQGAGIAVADVTGNGKLDVVVLLVDNPPVQNQALYRVGADLDATGAVTGGWGPWQPVPDWFSWENQGAGIAVADVTGNGKPDVVVLLVDNPVGPNQGLYRIGHDVDHDAATHEWGTWLGVPNWFSWENQYAGIAVAALDGASQLLVLMVDNPPGQNGGYVTAVRLTSDPRRDGSWELLKFDSQVLAIHAALLRTGKVMFFSGSGNNQVRAHSPDFGNMAKGIWTSVLWDPGAPAPGCCRSPRRTSLSRCAAARHGWRAPGSRTSTTPRIRPDVGRWSAGPR